ncbi:MAG: hypothetical protein EAZ55_12530 [Cytophagales bacterium]|nr:MAG: hypothetical protein EAZ55_12530 [Cytophagales bacterium]
MKFLRSFGLYVIFTIATISLLKAQCTSGDCENGFGTYLFSNGDKYVGQWKNGLRHGQGTYTWSMSGDYAGDVYVGQFANDKRNGFGTYTYADGTLYTGQWVNGEEHGQGTMTWPSGSTYTGNFDEGYRTGKGTYVWGRKTQWAGDRYEGDFLKNKRHGYGTYTYSSGKIEKGYFENDTYMGQLDHQTGCISGDCENGFGTYVFNNGDKYVGQWLNGERHGQGTYTWSNDGDYAGDSYTGDFKNNKRSGVGTYSYGDGTKYVGQWLDGKIQGKGKMTWVSGSSYEGDFVNDEREGNGTYIWGASTDNAGDKYVGQWKAGNRTGRGTYTYASGTINDGIFENNEYIGPAQASQASVSWKQPELLNTTIATNSYTIKACINSTSNVQSAQVFVNGVLQQNTRGFDVVAADNCTNTLERTITLNQGKNEIKIVITNGGGVATSEIRNITYTPANATATTVSNEKRYALVIGNANYDQAPLKNPVNDANSVATALKSKGFDVVVLTNLSKDGMIKAIREFGTRLQNGGVGLFYFAGHGMEVNGQNYLIPVGADIQKEQDVEFESVLVDRVLAEMEYARNGMNIVILDACRDNPFKSTRGGAKGLVTVDAPVGTLVAYATAPGSVAADGEGSNGLYTQELLSAMELPGLTVEQMFKQVRINVLQKSNNAQKPWENSSIVGDFYFSK